MGGNKCKQTLADFAYSNDNHLSKLINEFNLEVLNASKKCHGTFTRVNNKNCDEKSVLDYLIASSELNKYTNSMSVDEQKQFTPWRTLKGGKRFSDHNAILLNIDLPLKGDVQKSVRKTTWNFSDQSGWVKLTSLTERDSALTAGRIPQVLQYLTAAARKGLIHSCINLLKSVESEPKN